MPATVVIIPLTSTLRTTLLSVSRMYMFPEESTFTPRVKSISALVAGPPSPLKPGDPPMPATVVIIPLAIFAAFEEPSAAIVTTSLHER